jgi:hypothetical protein
VGKSDIAFHRRVVHAGSDARGYSYIPIIVSTAPCRFWRGLACPGPAGCPLALTADQQTFATRCRWSTLGMVDCSRCQPWKDSPRGIQVWRPNAAWWQLLLIFTMGLFILDIFTMRFSVSTLRESSLDAVSPSQLPSTQDRGEEGESVSAPSGSQQHSIVSVPALCVCSLECCVNSPAGS